MSDISANRPEAVAALTDPAQRTLYRFVADAEAPVSRDDASAALSVPRSTIALQLDRLVEVGLLTVEFARRTGRTGPGAGRPAKLYRASESEVMASTPERHYELAAELLASAAENAEEHGIPMQDALAAQARETGARIGAASGTVDAALVACGYEPLTDEDGRVILANCPFHTLARRHTNLVCNANLELLRGILDGAGDPRDPVLAPMPNRCCVAVEPLARPAV